MKRYVFVPLDINAPKFVRARKTLASKFNKKYPSEFEKRLKAMSL